VTDLNALSALDRAGLKQLWRKWWERPAPPQASRALLILALAYRIQQSAQGALSAASRKRLRHIAEKLDTRTRQPAPLVPGTRLIRQWRGQRHEVRVLERGYLYRGTRYASLSAIACLISGTHCSGPRFFGLAPGSTLPRKVTGGR
jgi:hypothetical protein